MWTRYLLSIDSKILNFQKKHAIKSSRSNCWTILFPCKTLTSNEWMIRYWDTDIITWPVSPEVKFECTGKCSGIYCNRVFIIWLRFLVIWNQSFTVITVLVGLVGTDTNKWLDNVKLSHPTLISHTLSFILSLSLTWTHIHSLIKKIKKTSIVIEKDKPTNTV